MSDMAANPRFSPDPSALTTEALHREVSGLRDLMDSRIDGVIETNKVFKENLERVPTALQSTEARLKEFYEAQFKSIAQRIVDSAAIITARLDAQKDLATAQDKSNAAAIKKSEESTSESIKSSNEKIAALTQRLDRGEGTVSGVRENRSDSRANVVLAATVGSLLLSILTGFVGFNVASHWLPVPPPTPVPAPAPYAPPPGWTLVPLVPAVPAAVVPAAPR